MRNAKKQYFQKVTEHDIIICVANSRYTYKADVPKNLTANAFSNHFLSVSESLIEP